MDISFGGHHSPHSRGESHGTGPWGQGQHLWSPSYNNKSHHHCCPSSSPQTHLPGTAVGITGSRIPLPARTHHPAGSPYSQHTCPPAHPFAAAAGAGGGGRCPLYSHCPLTPTGVCLGGAPLQRGRTVPHLNLPGGSHQSQKNPSLTRAHHRSCALHGGGERGFWHLPKRPQKAGCSHQGYQPLQEREDVDVQSSELAGAPLRIPQAPQGDPPSSGRRRGLKGLHPYVKMAPGKEEPIPLTLLVL